MIDFELLRGQLPPLTTVLRDLGVDLAKQGSRWFARCPLPGHQDRNPSFSVFADGLRCGCPVCDWNGDVFEATQVIQELPSAAAAAEALAERYGIEIPGTAAAPRPKHRSTPPPPETDERKTKRGRAIEHYDYTDEAGAVLYRVTRYAVLDEETGEPIIKPNGKPDKTFRQAKSDGAGGWVASMAGVRYVLYRLPQVLAADTVWLCEGERDVHALEAAGCVATTDAGGAGARAQFAKRGYLDTLRGKTVIVVPDTDPVGRERGVMLAHALLGVAAAVKLADITPYADVRDALEAGVTVADLKAMARPFQPTREDDRGREGDDSRGRSSDRTAGRKSTMVATAIGVAGGAADWEQHWPILKGAGNPAPVLANVLHALRNAPKWAGKFAWDEFGLRSMLRGGSPWSSHSGDLPIGDLEELKITEWLQTRGCLAPAPLVGTAIMAVAKEAPFHPVRQYLDLARAMWDGKRRLESWLERYLGVEDETGFAAESGTRWLISGVARIMQPGCKADCALVLEGGEGVRKSTAVKVLAAPWFADELPAMGTKDAAIACAGVWIVEIAEMHSLVKTGSWEAVKAFMSRSDDRYRPPYGRHAQSFPRQCVFAGTTNDSEYLEQREGARRFWSVHCRYISLQALQQDRDQLWGEAAARYAAGEQWWLRDDYRDLARANQDERVISDSWEDLVLSWLEAPTQRHWKSEGAISSTRDSVVLGDVLKYCIGLREADWRHDHTMKVSRILQRNGYVRHRVHDEALGRHWRYIRTR